MQTGKTVSSQLPKSPEEEQLLTSAVLKLLKIVPEVWTESSYDELTATEQRATFLLVSAGMIERRMRFRIRPYNGAGGFEAVIRATGESGLGEALENLIPRLWDEWQKVRLEKSAGDQMGSSPFHWERLSPEKWRLTDQGALAVSNLERDEPDIVLDFVFQRKFFSGRKSVGGSGELLSLKDLSGENVEQKTVHVGNWNEGAEAFAASFAQSFVSSMDQAQEGDRSEESRQGGSAGDSPSTPSASEPQESDAHQKLKPFSSGTMVFFRDRVELCGVDICSGLRSERRRRALDFFRLKKAGQYVAYSGKKLAEKLGLVTGQNGAARVVCDLRRRIKKELLSQANIECGDKDVILSRRTGYRFSDKLSVQDWDDVDKTRIQGHEKANVVYGDPVNDPVHDPVTGSDDPVKARRSWILHEVGKGRKLRAPHIAEELKCSLPTIKRDLLALKEENRIEFVGSTRTGHYRLRKPPGTDQ